MSILAQLSGDLRRVREALGGNDGEQSIPCGIFGDDVDGFHVPFRIGIRQYVDRVAATPVGRKKIIEGVNGIGRQDREFAAGSHERVRCQHARPASVGDDAEVWSARTRLLA